MTDYQKYRELLDGYFEGSLSASEESKLLNKIATDTDLKGEFEFQKDIINTIKETRRLELKNRLDNINIKWYHTVSNGWKVAATATIITVSTLTAYYFINQEEDLRDKIDLAQNEYILDAYNNEKDIPRMPVTETPEKVEESDIVYSEPVVNAKKEDENKAEETMEIRADRTIDVIVPDVIEEFEDIDNIDMENITSGDINTMGPSREDLHSSVEIRSVIDKKYTFHYTLSGGMLTLYGNFEDVPYEILEINSASGKRFYLKYKDHFYNIINTSDITPLEPVTNEALINELKIVKDNK